jgi:hypothetical protein
VYPSSGLSEEELDLLSFKLEAASRLIDGKELTDRNSFTRRPGLTASMMSAICFIWRFRAVERHRYFLQLVLRFV